MQGKNKSRLAYDMRIREALEIRHHNSGPGRGLNEDMGAYVKTDIWDPGLNTPGTLSIISTFSTPSAFSNVNVGLPR